MCSREWRAATKEANETKTTTTTTGPSRAKKHYVNYDECDAFAGALFGLANGTLLQLAAPVASVEQLEETFVGQTHAIHFATLGRL